MTTTSQPFVPTMGLGTFRLKGDVAVQSVRDALAVGYRHIDTAQIYENEAEVGLALSESGVPRREVFVTTKIWVTHFAQGKLIPSLRESLKKLRTEQVDLTLIHWPSPNDEVPMRTFLTELARARQEGLTRHIGVSNFNIALLRQALDILGTQTIATNQVEIHPYLQNRKLVAFAREQGIHLTSYMTLAVGKVVHDPVIQAIAQAHHATPAQVALAWAVQQGFSVIPSSTKRANLQSNLEALRLKLSPDDMARIATLDRGERIANPASLAPKWD